LDPDAEAMSDFKLWLDAKWKEERVMEDFPMWLKLVVWLVVGSSLIYAIAAVVYYSVFD
jgi:hypothetical protein